MSNRNTFHTVTAILLVLAIGCSKSEEPSAVEDTLDLTIPDLSDHNLIVIVVDSLRADHLGSYGYERPTSPFIDSLASEGLVFERAKANSSYVTQSLSTLFSGRLPTSGGTIGLLESHPLDDTTTLPQWFTKAGFYTGIVSNQPLIKGKGFTKGFEDLQIGSMESAWSGLDVSRRALSFVEDAADDPFMLYLHYLDPHQPYTPGQEYYDRLGEEANPKALDLGAFRRDYANALDAIGGVESPLVEEVIRQYDAEIAYTDHCIQQFVEGLAELDKLDNTVIVITSNHGEEFLEHDYVGNAWTLFEEVLHVPLIVWAKGAIDPRRIPTPVSLADLAPTLLNLFAIDPGDSLFDGEALFTKDGSALSFRAPKKPQIAELVIRERTILRSVTQDDWKYIAGTFAPPPEDRYTVAIAFNTTVNGIIDGTIVPPQPWGADAYEALFNLAEDPRETRNLLDSQSEMRDRLKAALAEYERACLTVGLQPRAASGALEVLDISEIEDLESLGYL